MTRRSREINFFEGQIVSLKSVSSGGFIRVCQKRVSVYGDGIENKFSLWRVIVVGTLEVVFQSDIFDTRYLNVVEDRLTTGIKGTVFSWKRSEKMNSFYFFLRDEDDFLLGVNSKGSLKILHRSEIGSRGLFEVNSLMFDDIRYIPSTEKQENDRTRVEFLNSLQRHNPNHLKEKDVQFLDDHEYLLQEKKKSTYREIQEKNYSNSNLNSKTPRKSISVLSSQRYNPYFNLQKSDAQDLQEIVSKITIDLKKGISLYIQEGDFIPGYYNIHDDYTKKLHEAMESKNTAEFFSSYFCRNRIVIDENFTRNHSIVRTSDSKRSRFDYHDEMIFGTPYRSKRNKKPWNYGIQDNFFSPGKVYICSMEMVNEKRTAIKRRIYCIACCADSSRVVAKLESSEKVGLVRLVVHSLSQIRKILDQDYMKNDFFIARL